jgi:hypothetical protein
MAESGKKRDTTAYTSSVTSVCLSTTRAVLVLHRPICLLNSLTWMTENVASNATMPSVPPIARQMSTHLDVRNHRRNALMAPLRMSRELFCWRPRAMAVSSGHAHSQSSYTRGGNDCLVTASKSSCEMAAVLVCPSMIILCR